jgi:hypothetical protein
VAVVPAASEVPYPTILLTHVSQLVAFLPTTVYPPVAITVVFTVRPWHLVHDDFTFASVTVDVGVQDCDRTGVPPVQPVGDDVATVLVCVPLDWHVPQAVYVNEVQVVTGGTYVHDCDRTCVPPVQPVGDDVATVLVCMPLDWHVPQAVYVNEVQVVTGGTYVHDCDRTGVPPVQPVGDDVATVLVCVPLDWQVPQAVYVNEVQVDGVDERPARKFA